MLLILFILTCIFAIGMRLKLLQSLYFLLALITTVYIFKFVFEYKYLDGEILLQSWGGVNTTETRLIVECPPKTNLINIEL